MADSQIEPGKSVATTRTATLSQATDDGFVESDHIQPVQSNSGIRPACFKNTFQEVLFVLTATMVSSSMPRHTLSQLSY